MKTFHMNVTKFINYKKMLIIFQFENISLIEYQVECLRESGIKNVFVVTGFESEKIRCKLGNQVNYIHNSEFATTNNIHSILKAKDFMKSDFICIYGDLFFHKNILKKCVNSKNEMALMIEEDLRDETTKVKIEKNKIILVNKNIDFKNADGNFIGMMKCSKYYKEDFFQAIEDLANTNSQAYYTIGIEKMIKDGKRVNFETTDGLPWIDIDTHEDLLFAKEVFARD